MCGLWTTIQTYRTDTEVLRQVQAKSSRLETLRDSGGGEAMSEIEKVKGREKMTISSQYEYNTIG